MWKLKIAQGSNPWLRTLNDHVGRQVWEFDPKLGSPEELAEIEKARENFRIHLFEKKHSSDLLMRLQVIILSSAILVFTYFFSLCCFIVIVGFEVKFKGLHVFSNVKCLVGVNFSGM